MEFCFHITATRCRGFGSGFFKKLLVRLLSVRRHATKPSQRIHQITVCAVLPSEPGFWKAFKGDLDYCLSRFTWKMV